MHRGPVMRWLSARVVCALVGAVLVAVTGLAQSYRVDTYSVEDGLPSSEVFDLAQGRTGRLWLATRGGLTSFDGLSWKLHTPPEVPTRQVAAVASDQSGQIWALFMDVEWTVGRWDGAGWTWLGPIEQPGGRQRPSDFAVTATEEVGSVVALATDGDLWLGRADGWMEVVGLEGARAVEPWNGGFVVLCDEELVIVGGDGDVTRPWSGWWPRGSELLAVEIGPDGMPWVLSERGLARIGANALEMLVADLPTGAESIAAASRISLAVAPGGEAVYLASWNALFRLDVSSGQLERLGPLNGLQNDGATAILVDREGLVWVAGLRGLSKIISLQFASLQRQHGLLEDEVTAVCETSTGRLVLGHNLGISVLPAVQGDRQGSVNRMRAERELEQIAFARDVTGWTGVRILDCWASPDDRDETVWLAASGLGLAQWQPETGLTRPDSADVVERPTSVTGTDDGSVWVAGHNGLFRARRGERSLQRVWSPRSALRRVQSSQEGGLWVAAINAGVYRWRDGVATHIPGPEDDAELNVFSVAETGRGETFMASRAGLLRLDGARLVFSRAPEGPEIRRPVYCLVEGPDGALWVGTDDGYARWLDGMLSWYGPHEGLVGREANRAAGFVDRHGELWLGTDRGVSRFRSDVEPARGAAPIVRLDRVLAGERELAPDEPVRLGPYEGSMTVRFSAVSLYDENDVAVQAKLMPVEESWNTTAQGVRKEIRYTNLQPGQYRVSIRARSATGQWSEAVTSAPIRVLPPLWRRAWFVLLTALAALGVTLTAGRIWLQARYARLLEAKVTERTAELAASQKRYHWLFHGSILGKIVVDDELRMAEVNAAAVRLCGVRLDDLEDRRLDEIPVEWCRRVAEELSVSWGRQWDGDVTRLVVTGRDGSGFERDMEVWVSPDAQRRLMLLTVDDVTERRRLEHDRLRASKLESVGQLAGGLAHDFNNILAGILGNLSIARIRAQKGQDPGAYLDSAEGAVERAKGITAQLLTFARGGAPVRRLADIGLLASENAELVLAGSSVGCAIAVDEELWPAEVDASQIGQVVNNLVMNAAQAMPDGGVVELSISNRQLDSGEHEGVGPGPYVELRVSDTGVGVPESIRDKVFDPYFTTKESGSGLGLSSVYSIVKQHGGLVSLDSAEGHGTSVTVLIPASPDEAPAVEPSVATTVRGSGRVLVMDDDVDLQEVYRDVLEELGYESEVVGDGQRAIEAAARAAREGRPFDVAVLDLTVPGGMGGREAVSVLKEQHPGLRAVVASGYSSDPVMADHQSAGFDGVLRKPFSIAQLAEALDAARGSSSAP